MTYKPNIFIMPEKHYLYGAAVQGIQNFIFQTDKLKDIVGASELVEHICKKIFMQYAKDGRCVVNAAGNIKYIFHSKSACEEAVLKFPFDVMNMAPGITVSQAVVKMEGDHEIFENAVDELELRLKAQRNKPFRSATIGFMGMLRSRTTGQPAVGKIDFQDEATQSKLRFVESKSLSDKCFGDLKFRKTTTDINKLTGKNDWLAVIHADGNGLGNVVKAIGKDQSQLSEFSSLLEEATSDAAKIAFDSIVNQFEINDLIPIRPIIIGGDDLTVICRGDIAIDYTKAFLAAFENKTKAKMATILTSAGLPFDYLTSCAGIAYIKSSFPFHYGYQLAESLCKKSKEIAKLEECMVNGLAPSCMMFHKVQDSFITDIESIFERELQPQANLTLVNGPYFLRNTNNWWSIDKLMKNVNSLKSDDKRTNAIKSNLRQWLSLLYVDLNKAKQKQKRMESILGDDWKAYELESLTVTEKKNPVYDILSLCSIRYKETKGEAKS